MKQIRVAFVASSDSSFISRDRELLKEFASVRNVMWNGIHSIPSLVWAVLRSDVAFSWFALDHAYGAVRLSRIFGKRSIVVVGGVDAARVPELGYGVFLNERMSARTRYAIKNADRVLVVDDFLREEIAHNAGIRRPEIVTVPTGYDTAYFRPDEGARTTVLTVGIVSDVNLLRKGLTTFIEAARRLPDFPFVLVGARDNRATSILRATAPPNVRILGMISQDALLEEYRRARVYVQASTYEGLPNALAEAMSCGCVPVGTEVAGVPTLIGDTGFYVPVGDPDSTAEAIRRAFVEGDGAKARNRIIEHFTISKRRQALRALVQELLDGDGMG